MAALLDMTGGGLADAAGSALADMTAAAPAMTPTLTSQVPSVTDWLVAACKASPALAGVSVFDGPQVPADTQSLESVLWVGCNPADISGSSTSAEQTWPLMDHGLTRQETGVVEMAVQHWSGDTTVKTHRDACAAMAGAVELLLRGDGADGPGDMTMGGLVWWSAVDGPFAWYSRQNAQGASCLLTFSISYDTRLTTGAA